jgi:hypothetical protein
MARGNTYVCATCGKVYDFCLKCAITKPNFNAERYCTAAHADIFAILSKHGCHLATAEETLEALKGYDLTGLTEDIQAHINSLQPKKVEVEVKEVETTFKKNKFRTQE